MYSAPDGAFYANQSPTLVPSPLLASSLASLSLARVVKSIRARRPHTLSTLAGAQAEVTVTSVHLRSIDAHATSQCI